jgi:hypothetical protein
MKKIRTNNKQQTTILIIVLMLAGIMLSNLKSYSQAFFEYTKKYANTYTGGLVFSDNVVVEPFRASSALPTTNGFVIFQSEYDGSSMSNLIIHLIDDAGTILLTRRYDLNVSGAPPVAQAHMVPVAAAYNAVTSQYIVVGNGRSMNNTTRTNPWYLVLDQNINVVSMGAIDLISTTGIGANDNNTMVTDVCAIESVNTLSFAMVGMILDNVLDASPKVPSAFAKRMFISTLSNTFVATSMEYQLTIAGAPVDPYYFASRIIEVPTATNGGLFVTGTGANAANNDAKGFFYFRTDYALAPTDFVSLDNPSNIDDFFAGGNLKYDIGSDDILVSGTINGNSNNGPAFFFDKIIDVSTTSFINSFSTSAAWWNNSLGTKRLPTSMSGYTKSGAISTASTNSGNFILGKLYNNTISLTLPVALECRFGDNDLNNWVTNQTTNLEYYSRQVNNIPPVQFYDGYNWDEIWYPCHSSAEYPFAPYGSYQYGMAGLDDAMGVTTVAMNFTDAVYNNLCSRISASVALNMIPVSTIGTVTVTNQAPAQVQYTPPYNIITPNIPAETDCINIIFKPAGSSKILNISENNFFITENATGITVSCNLIDKKYKLLNLFGSVVAEGPIVNSTANIDTKSLATGMYIIMILDQHEHQVKSLKFIQK